MKIEATEDGIIIKWDNNKQVKVTSDHFMREDFWKIIQILLEDARREGEIFALQKAAENAQIQIDAQKKLSTPRILV